MGLDMYLTGNALEARSEGKRPKRDGFDIIATRLDLGYWRKHRMLHGYIVQNFADGVDDCRRIELEEEDLSQIEIALLKWADNSAALPKTEGFFFGDDEGDEYYRKRAKEDAGMFREARRWLQKKQDDVWKSVEYEASW
jgi:hypothetical protein|tara:strand:+ start:286 stop:702 length:417 start_codon:yes stop_codon:yes gene_type:complete